MEYIIAGVFFMGVLTGSLMTTCLTHFFLKKYEAEEEAKEQEPEVIEISVPVPEPIVDNSPEYDVWRKF